MSELLFLSVTLGVLFPPLFIFVSISIIVVHAAYITIFPVLCFFTFYSRVENWVNTDFQLNSSWTQCLIISLQLLWYFVVKYSLLTIIRTHVDTILINKNYYTKSMRRHKFA